MKKKLFLILVAGFLAFGLSGCAKRGYNDYPLRSVHYYIKHPEKIVPMIKACNQESIKTMNYSEAELSHMVWHTNFGADCRNASAASGYVPEKYLHLDK